VAHKIPAHELKQICQVGPTLKQGRAGRCPCGTRERLTSQKPRRYPTAVRCLVRHHRWKAMSAHVAPADGAQDGGAKLLQPGSWRLGDVLGPGATTGAGTGCCKLGDVAAPRTASGAGQAPRAGLVPVLLHTQIIGRHNRQGRNIDRISKSIILMVIRWW
jgi:hypothetical protein